MFHLAIPTLVWQENTMPCINELSLLYRMVFSKDSQTGPAWDRGTVVVPGQAPQCTTLVEDTDL